MKKLLLGFVLLAQISFYGIGFAVEGGEAKVAELKAAESKAKYKVHIDTFEEDGKDITGENGIDLITNYIGTFYKAAAGIIGLICVLIVAVSGVQISLGGLSPEGVNQAKDRIIQALLSMALLFSSAAILKAINGGFFT